MQIVPSFANRYARNITEAQYPSLWRGLVGLWMPAMGIQADKLRDFSNTRNDAVCGAGITTAAWVGSQGLPQSGRSFPVSNSSTDLATVSPTRRLSITADITLMCWVKKVSAANTITFLGRTDNATSDYILQHTTSGAGVFRFFSNGTGVLAGATTFGLSKWFHVCFTRTGAAWKLYVNGRVDGSGSNATAFANNNLQFRIGTAATNITWTGSVADVRVHNRGLSTQEVKLSAAGWSPLSLREDLRMGAVTVTSLGNVYQMLI